MRLGNIFGHIINSKNTIRYSKADAAEISGLCETLERHGFKNIDVNAIDKNNARITANGHGGEISFDLDFLHRTETQITKQHSYTLSIIPPINEWIQVVKGSLANAKIIKTISRNKHENGDIASEIIEYRNLLSGNHFKMVRNGNEKPKFYRNIDGDFVEMFTKS
ncbi:hypothetical protein IKP85_04425 [bacterium]|nr:hypothetical protein [bacterium]